MSGNDELREERLKKLEKLAAAGLDPYPAHSERTATVANFLSSFDESNNTEATLAGRVLSIRKQGGIIFVTLFDGTERIQLVLQKAEMDEPIFTLFDETVDQGDFVEATGIAYVTKRGEKSLKVTTWRMLAKSLSPLPSEHFGIKDEELKLRQRYLDILLDPEVRAMFERRSKFWQSTREFLLKQNFMEVETPILENSPGGADARPFITHHNALDMQVYLRISAGELWQKRLLVAGFPKIFEIGRIFRNEGQSREHLQDYTQLETYEAYSDMQKGKKFVQDLYRYISEQTYSTQKFTIGDHEVNLAKEWDEVDFCSAVEKKFGVHPLKDPRKTLELAMKMGILEEEDGMNVARAADQLWKQVRKEISGPAFLTGVPAYLEPLAKRSKENPDIVERFQVLIAGSEVGKGFSELNDPQDQAKRFAEQQALRDAGDDEAQRLDQDYIEAMEYGMPPAFGFGVSERLFAFLENRPAHETQLFPLLRPKQ